MGLRAGQPSGDQIDRLESDQKHYEMTRRDFLWFPVVAAATSSPRNPTAIVVPVHRMLDGLAKCTPERLRNFWTSIWPETYRDFSRCGIELRTTDSTGEIRRSAGNRPVFLGLQRGVINLVLTDHLPPYWDNGRALPGVATIQDGFHICLIALRYAHGHQVPYMSVNTCVHELLHALMQDIYVSRPNWFQTASREMRIDAYATRMWLFQEGAAVRKSALVYLEWLEPPSRNSISITPKPRNLPRSDRVLGSRRAEALELRPRDSLGNA